MLLAYTLGGGLLVLRHRSGRVSRPAPPVPAGLLCLPSAPRALLVEVPFTQHDVASLEFAVDLWERMWPCYAPPLRPSRPDLVLAFNGNLSEPRLSDAAARVRALLSRRVVHECFGAVSVESAHLSGAEDVYDKRRLDANWTVGPNNLFFKFLYQSAAR